MLATRNLNGREWVTGRAHDLVKARILELRNDDYAKTATRWTVKDVNNGKQESVQTNPDLP